jgi:hypothetical protein
MRVGETSTIARATPSAVTGQASIVLRGNAAETSYAHSSEIVPDGSSRAYAQLIAFPLPLAYRTAPVESSARAGSGDRSAYDAPRDLVNQGADVLLSYQGMERFLDIPLRAPVSGVPVQASDGTIPQINLTPPERNDWQASFGYDPTGASESSDGGTILPSILMLLGGMPALYLLGRKWRRWNPWDLSQGIVWTTSK